jgi:hypothetical protein
MATVLKLEYVKRKRRGIKEERKDNWIILEILIDL